MDFGDGHWQSDRHGAEPCGFFKYGILWHAIMSSEQQKIFYSNPYYPTFKKYYGGIESMMPWIKF
jgi:hypothetical protein